MIPYSVRSVDYGFFSSQECWATSGLLPASTVYPFSLLRCIRGLVMPEFTHSPSDGYVGRFQGLAVVNVHVHVLIFFLSKKLEIEQLGHTIDVCSILWAETAKFFFSKLLYRDTFPIALWEFPLLHTLANMGVLSLLDLSRFNVCAVVYHCGLKLQFSED